MRGQAMPLPGKRVPRAVCTSHPLYAAASEPGSACPACWAVWRLTCAERGILARDRIAGGITPQVRAH